MLGSLVKGEADFVSAPITFTPIRSDVVNFLHPIGMETYCVMIKKSPREHYSFLGYLKPFRYDLWVGLALALASVFGVMKAMEVFAMNGGEWSLSSREQFHSFISEQTCSSKPL